MIMGLLVRCRYWSILQVVAFVVYYWEKVSSGDLEGPTAAQASTVGEHVSEDHSDKESTTSHDYSNDAMISTAAQESTIGEHVSEDHSDKESTTSHDYSSYLTSDDGTLTNPTEAIDQRGPGTTIHEPKSQVLPVVMIVVFLIVLLGTVVPVVVVYHRKQSGHDGQGGQDGQVKMFPSVDQVDEIDRRQNEYDIDTNESHGQDENNFPLPLSMTDGAAAVYSEMVWKDDQSNIVTKDETKAANQQVHIAGPDVYAAVDKPSKAATASSALEMDLVGRKDPADMGDECFPNQIYSLVTTDVDDTYDNGTAL